MARKKKPQYQNEILTLWWEEIKIWFGWTDWVNAIFKTGLHIGGLIILWVNARIDAIFDSMLFEFGKLIITIFFIETIFFITYIRASSKCYEKDKKEIKRLIRKTNELQAVINQELIKVNIRFEVYDRLSENYASIKIFNDEKKDLTKCYVVPENIIAMYTSDPNREYDETESINPNNYFISWAGGDEGDGRKTIETKNYSVLNIAEIVKPGERISSYGLRFWFHKGSSRALWRPGNYKFKISLRGLIDGKPFQPEDFTFSIDLKVIKHSKTSGQITLKMEKEN